MEVEYYGAEVLLDGRVKIGQMLFISEEIFIDFVENNLDLFEIE